MLEVSVEGIIKRFAAFQVEVAASTVRQASGGFDSLDYNE